MAPGQALLLLLALPCVGSVCAWVVVEALVVAARALRIEIAAARLVAQEACDRVASIEGLLGESLDAQFLSGGQAILDAVPDSVRAQVVPIRRTAGKGHLGPPHGPCVHGASRAQNW